MKSVISGAAVVKPKLPPDLKLRILSAVILAPVVLGAAWLGGVVFLLLLAVAVILMAYEWARLTGGKDWFLDTGVATATAWGAMLAVRFPDAASMDSGFWPLLLAGLIVLAGAGISALLAWLRGQPMHWRLLGIPYISLGPLAMVWLRAQPDIGFMLTLWLLLLVWAMDIGAYFAGRAIGGPKLAPRASPNKTWAGLIGGMALAGAAGAALSLMTEGELAVMAGASMVLGCCAQAGDIAESMVKRHFGVKDMSNLIPGHGGILDRVDGLLAAAPLMLIYVILTGHGAL